MITFLILMSQILWAAPHNDSPQETSKVNSVNEALKNEISYSQVKRLVQFEGREEVLKKMGPTAYKYLRQLMMASEEDVEDRWKATIALAKIGGEDSLPDLEVALKHNQWFMRSAGLLGLSLAQRQSAEAKAKELLHSDPALLVRAVALQIVAQKKDIDKELLWSEIYNPINFNNGKGLPIRVSILKVLENKVTAADAPKLTALMRENNPEIQAAAKASLAKIYAQNGEGKNSSGRFSNIATQ